MARVENVMLIPSAVDRAVAQTHASGLKYAVMPKPVFIEWVQWCNTNGSRLPWRLICIGPGDGEANVDETEEGDVVICLLHPGHEGDCGGRDFLAMTDQVVNPT